MIKVDIISGFLGAGKTTFIKELIEKVFRNEKVVLIENEFGEIGIDSRFMQDAGIEVTEMNSGCICCTLVGDFAKALKKTAEVYRPGRILIEPSGVGKLSDVAQAVREMEPETGVRLNSTVTIVDGKRIGMYLKNFGEFYGNQVEHADTLVVSRSQMMSEAERRKCIDLLREKNQKAELIETPWEQLSGEALRKVLEHGSGECDCGGEHGGHGHEDCSHEHHGGEHSHQSHEHEHGDHEHEHSDGHEHGHHGHEECGCGHHHHEHHGHDHHHADEIFDSWGIETVHPFSRAELEDTLKLLSVSDELGTVLRAKGIVACDDGTWMEFDMVPEETEIRTCSPDPIGKLCVIGTDLKEDGLKQLFGR